MFKIKIFAFQLNFHPSSDRLGRRPLHNLPYFLTAAGLEDSPCATLLLASMLFYYFFG